MFDVPGARRAAPPPRAPPSAAGPTPSLRRARTHAPPVFPRRSVLAHLAHVLGAPRPREGRTARRAASALSRSRAFRWTVCCSRRLTRRAPVADHALRADHEAADQAHDQAPLLALHAREAGTKALAPPVPRAARDDAGSRCLPRVLDRSTRPLMRRRPPHDRSTPRAEAPPKRRRKKTQSECQSERRFACLLALRRDARAPGCFVCARAPLRGARERRTGESAAEAGAGRPPRLFLGCADGITAMRWTRDRGEYTHATFALTRRRCVVRRALRCVALASLALQRRRTAARARRHAAAARLAAQCRGQPAAAAQPAAADAAASARHVSRGFGGRLRVAYPSAAVRQPSVAARHCAAAAAAAAAATGALPHGNHARRLKLPVTLHRTNASARALQ